MFFLNIITVRRYSLFSCLHCTIYSINRNLLLSKSAFSRTFWEACGNKSVHNRWLPWSWPRDNCMVIRGDATIRRCQPGMVKFVEYHMYFYYLNKLFFGKYRDRTKKWEGGCNTAKNLNVCKKRSLYVITWQFQYLRNFKVSVSFWS